MGALSTLGLQGEDETEVEHSRFAKTRMKRMESVLDHHILGECENSFISGTTFGWTAV